MSSPEGTSPRPGILRKESAEPCASPSSYLGLSYSVSPRTAPHKSVSIAQHADTISPLILGQQKSDDEFKFGNYRQVKKAAGKSPRLAGKSPRLSGKSSNHPSPALKPLASAVHDSFAELNDNEPNDAHALRNQVHLLVDQISTWILDEREKRSKRKSRKSRRKIQQPSSALQMVDGAEESRPRRSSDASDDSCNFDKLEDIVKQVSSISNPSRRQSLLNMKQRLTLRQLRHKRSISSDTEHVENEFSVPSCDAVLDNTKTLSYTGGASDESDVSSSDELRHVPSYKDHDAWATFKFEIVRLAHTLRLKGWRKVPMEMSGGIFVQRLSGALTNAVYVVSPPHEMSYQKPTGDAGNAAPSKSPPKLLLRIYGPQVEHLIDRESELAILKRLARKRIGPRLLGTFANGRFEEFLNAQTLTAEEMRGPDTSRQIAKRMRELHQGVELLNEERDEGPFVWRNWDKWLARVEQVVCWMDQQIQTLEPGVKPVGVNSWMRRGHICGVPWKQFRETVEKYRVWLEAQYGCSSKVRQELVFAHNDTQYGNLLRLIPTGESPLLLPANTHKQLVVIDFEYASANTPGLEFANHFTEWCYNYHDKRKPYACNTNRYPTMEEQDRFIRAYVRHQPHFSVETPHASMPSTPSTHPSTPGEPARRPTTSISEFMLDARSPRAASETSSSIDGTMNVKSSEDAEVSRLMQETRKWRLANTAQWVAWGLIQAKVPGMPDFDTCDQAAPESDAVVEDSAREILGDRADEYKALAKEQQAQGPEEEQEEFDYLGYAQHRAMWFWGDAIQLGIVKAEELPEETRAKIKTVIY